MPHYYQFILSQQLMESIEVFICLYCSGSKIHYKVIWLFI